eukprot:671945-Hanusia_phi.AAC.1
MRFRPRCKDSTCENNRMSANRPLSAQIDKRYLHTAMRFSIPPSKSSIGKNIQMSANRPLSAQTVKRYLLAAMRFPSKKPAHAKIDHVSQSSPERAVHR